MTVETPTETPEAKAARLTLAFLTAIRSGDDSAPDAPAAEIVGAVLGAILRSADALDRMAQSAKAAAVSLDEIALELKAGKAFRERERRHGR